MDTECLEVLIIAPQVLKPYLGPSVVASNTLKGFLALKSQLERENIHITVLSLKDKRTHRLCEEVSVIGFNHHPYLADIGSFLIRSNKKFDIIHSHDVIGILPWVFDSKVIYTLHGIFWRERTYRQKIAGRLRSWISEKLFGLWYPRLTKLVAISQYIIDELKAKSFDTSKAVIIENPVSDEFFDIKKKEEPIILYPATIIPLKNQLGFLKAVVMIKDELKDYEIIFAGSGDRDYEQKLRDFVARNGLNVEFLGEIPYEEMLELYSKASIVALASFQESLPMVVLEAMATGTPIIASNVGGIPYSVKNGQNGFIVNPYEYKDIAEKLLILMNDENLRKKIGKEAKTEAERRWKAEMIARKHLDLFLKVRG